MNDPFRGKKKAKREWGVYERVLQALDKNSDYKKNSSTIISQKNSEVNILLKKARKFYNNGDFINSAKVFRHLGKVVRNIEFECEVKGSYDERNSLNDLTGKEWLRHTKSWLVVDGKPSDIPKEIKDHPASYPPDLAKHFLRFFTKKGDWVFDPFMGIGSTIAASKDLSRHCWGIELNVRYAKYAQRRISNNQSNLESFISDKQKVREKYHIINDDSRNCYQIWKKLNIPKANFILTSPPYWNILGESRGGVKSTHKKRAENGLDEKYSEKEEDLGNILSYTKYLDDLTNIFKDISKFTISNGYIVVILQNVRPKSGVMVPIAWDVAKKLSDIFILRQEFIWCQDQKFMGIWGYPTTYVSNVHHHYCLVFQNKK